MLLPFSIAIAFFIQSGSADLTVGTQFIVAFPCLGQRANLFLFFVNPNSADADVTIQSPYSGFDTMNPTVSANSTQQVMLFDPSLQVCEQSTTIQKGILVQSTVPVTLYVDLENSDGYTFVTFLALPVDMLAKQYRYAYSGSYSRPSYWIATQDNTQIMTADSGDSITLNRLEVYYQPAIYRPRAFVSSNMNFVYIPFTSGSNDAQMALPDNFVSTAFPILPEANCTTQYADVYAFQDTTYIIKDGLTYGEINNGEVLQVPFSSSGSLNSNHNVQVYMEKTCSTSGYAFTANSYVSSAVLFHPITHLQYSNHDPIHTLELIVPIKATGQISLDGRVIPALQYVRIANTQSYYYRIEISADQHVLAPISSDGKFIASIYSSPFGYNRPNNKFVIGLNLPRNN